MATAPDDRLGPADRDGVTTFLVRRMRATRVERERAELLDQVVRLNLPLARSIAMSFAHKGVDLDDLHQVASLGLLKAIRGFDDTRGPCFAAYAVPTIRGELRRYFRDHASSIRPPRQLQELRAAIAATRESLTHRLGREASVHDLSEAVGASCDQIRLAQISAVNRWPQSLDAAPTATAALCDRLATLHDETDLVVQRMTLQDAVGQLDERSRAILWMRFIEELSQAQIAARLGVSQMQVSRLLARILTTLRVGMDSDAPRSTPAERRPARTARRRTASTPRRASRVAP